MIEQLSSRSGAVGLDPVLKKKKVQADTESVFHRYQGHPPRKIKGRLYL